MKQITQEAINSGKMPKYFQLIAQEWKAKYNPLTFENAVQEGFSEIKLKGPITDELTRKLYEDWFETDVTISAKVFEEQLSAVSGDVLVRINSPGGSIFEASDMRQLLMERQEGGDRVHAIVDGLCASAAVKVLTGASYSEITDMGAVMMHHVSAGFYANIYGMVEDLEAVYQDLGNLIGQLKNLNQNDVAIYAEKFGKSSEEILEVMKKEEFFVGQNAVDYGIVDKVYQVTKRDEKEEEGITSEGSKKMESKESVKETPEQFRLRMQNKMKEDYRGAIFIL